MLNLLSLYGSSSTALFSRTPYEGTGASNSIFTGVNNTAEGGLVLTKDTDSGGSNYLFDSVRGVENYLRTNTTGAEVADANSLTAFGGAGFTLGTGSNYNNSGVDFLAFNWAEDPDYLDTVQYTGTAANLSVAHGLNSAPKLAIVKNMDTATDWAVWHPSIDIGLDRYILELNTSDPRLLSSTAFQETAPDSTNLYVGANTLTNTLSDEHVAYLFAEKAGSSKFGAYAGNGSTQSVTGVGFKPSVVLIKDVTGTDDWTLMWENSPGSSVTYIRLNTSDTPSNTSNANITDDGFDFASGGFQNTTGRSYIYAAWK